MTTSKGNDWTPDQMAAIAATIVREEVLDDLIESGNGVTLDEAWASATIDNLILSRDRPDEYLMTTHALPGSPLAEWQAERRKRP